MMTLKRFKARLSSARTWVVGLPYFWLILFLVFPFVIIFKLSFSEMTIGLPPFTPFMTINELIVNLHINFNNYYAVFFDGFYLSAYLNSLKVAAISTLGCLLIGYPMAYFIARVEGNFRSILLMLVVLPSWISFLLRVYAWMGILQDNGLINQTLLYLGIIDKPIQFMYTEFAIYLGIIYAYLPFMVLPIFVSVSKMDWTLLNAAADLGARPFKAFRTITLPLTLGGVFSGSLLVFIPAVGEFVIPDLLGGSSANMIGRLMWMEFFSNRDWPLSAALATVMLLILLIPIYMFTRVEQKRQSEGESV